MEVPRVDTSVNSPTMYKVRKNARMVLLIVGAVYVVFAAGAIFTGYKPNFAQWVTGIIVTANAIAQYFNKPIPPPQ